MTAGLMRRFSSSIRKPLQQRANPQYRTVSRYPALQQPRRITPETGAGTSSISKRWFTSAPPCWSPEPGHRDHKPPDERTLKLGKTIRILHDRLPTLLASPLPQEILSPQITLHLFPSTHPHLPTVSGKIPYTAALWTAPVAWGRVPVVGNVKLIILSERMVKNGANQGTANGGKEKLIVKWKTCSKDDGGQQSLYNQGSNTSEAVQKVAKVVEDSTQPDEEFVGLFIFEFDEEGRIVSHTIEHVEEGGYWEKMTKVISVTDWLLGRAWGKRSEDGSPGLAWAQNDGHATFSPRRKSP
ncbi:hypothetical protein GQ43DRAFT_413939 [Delitschia confertaspora ATCC 74209]|uniref:Uncharacterized protein n=1 Tax=Delitschia confertaspora ATCC 74209 TaxID=1513339 RepID=A0A9P4JTI7_9PLEO|nr:hypothetical protein GQ43DRAFT_413939 [Delitschia confertaspora ATCC 74209]